MGDARFEDGAEAPLYLRAETAEDLPVISALVQDAVFPAGEMRWDRRRRCFAILLNRFRWEDQARAEAQGRRFERVRSLLVVGDVLAVASQGIDPKAWDLVLSLLALEFRPEADGAGHLILTLAGDGAIRLAVECLDITLRDMTRPYLAAAQRAPDHPGD